MSCFQKIATGAATHSQASLDKEYGVHHDAAEDVPADKRTDSEASPMPPGPKPFTTPVRPARG